MKSCGEGYSLSAGGGEVRSAAHMFRKENIASFEGVEIKFHKIYTYYCGDDLRGTRDTPTRTRLTEEEAE